MFQLISFTRGRSRRWTALVAEQQNGNGISLRSSNVSALNARVTESPTDQIFSCQERQEMPNLSVLESSCQLMPIKSLVVQRGCLHTGAPFVSKLFLAADCHTYPFFYHNDYIISSFYPLAQFALWNIFVNVVKNGCY